MNRKMSIYLVTTLRSQKKNANYAIPQQRRAFCFTAVTTKLQELQASAQRAPSGDDIRTKQSEAVIGEARLPG
jgi:hypothetical protein